MVTKYNYIMSAFENEDDFSYYLLGAFITDGCVYKTRSKDGYACQLSSIDVDWLREIADKIGTNLKLHNFRENYYGIRIIRTNIAKWFINHGCLPRKTLTVKFPNVPDKYISDFLRGCMDGDGSIGTYLSKNNYTRKITLISASIDFLKEVQNQLTKNNIKSSVIERKQKDGCINGKIIKAKSRNFILLCHGLNAYKFLKFVYYEHHKISLKRKNKKAQEIISFYENRKYLDMRKIKDKNNPNIFKITWPSDEILIKMLKECGFEKTAQNLSISSSAIRRRLKSKNIYNDIVNFKKDFKRKEILEKLPPKENLINDLKYSTYKEIATKLNIKNYRLFISIINKMGIKK